MIAGAVGLWVAIYAACGAVAIARHRARAARPLPSPRPRGTSDVVLLRPCAGAEPGLADRLTEAGGASRVVIAVGEADDEATPAATSAVARLRARGVDAHLVVTHAVGPNHKVDQLDRALRQAPGARDAEVVVVADSDVDLAGVALDRFVAELDATGIGAVWAPPIEAGAIVGSGDALSHAVLGASLHAFPLLSGIDASGMVGKLFALRREVLEQVGGFEDLRSHLGEDMELARRIRERGLRVATSPLLARSRAEGRSRAVVRARYVRWLQVVRAQRTALLASYPLLLAAAPLLLVGLLAGVIGRDPGLVSAASLGLLVRLAIAIAARRAAGLPAAPARAARQALVADLTLLGALVVAVRSRQVSWRRGTLTLGPGGTLLATEPTS